MEPRTGRPTVVPTEKRVSIERLEREQHGLFQAMGDSALYKKDRADIIAANDRLHAVKELLAHAYARWEELEQIQLDSNNSRPSG